MKKPDAETGLSALRSLLFDRSLIGPLRIMGERVGKFFQIPLPGFKPYVVFGPENVRKVLITESSKFRWRNNDPVRDVLQKGVLVTDGDEHDRYRSLMEKMLHPGVLPQYKEMMLRQTDRVTDTWQNGQTVDMLVEARKIALLIVMEALFSVDVWQDIPLLWNPILKAIEYISPGLWIFWRKMPRFGYKRSFKIIDDYLFGIIHRRRASLEKKQDLLQHLIDAGLSDQIIRDQMLTMLIAGHDTSTALLAWIFAMLAKDPSVYEKLNLAMENAEEDKQPHLLEEVIKETLRLYPPIHIGNRMVAEEVSFGEGETIPAGERLFYSIYLTQRDPDLWEKPDDFCPERFQPGARTNAMSYIPFGGGSRACIGSAFGMMEARTTLAHLLHGFTFEPMNADKIHLHMGATLEPHPGVLMRVSRKARTL
jgi:cytochrome P450